MERTAGTWQHPAMQPATRYARLGSDRIAYQVVGEGPPDLVLAGIFGHVDMFWEDPRMSLFLRGLASFSRLIRFDRRGTGASDPMPGDRLTPWESYAEELVAVMDEVGSARAAVMALGAQASAVSLFSAATRPERTSALVLVDATARYLADDDYPIGLAREAGEALVARAAEGWGTEELAAANAPPGHQYDERFTHWAARFQRAMASPSAAAAYLRALLEVDVRPVLASLDVPTLVLAQTRNPMVPVEHGRYLAEHIKGARLLEIEGDDPALIWSRPEVLLDAAEAFLTGEGGAAGSGRVLATVLFTDIVASTERAGRLGDRRWRELLDLHDDLARRLAQASGGQVVKTTGDGVLATFDGPARAIRYAAALRAELDEVGVRIRAGLHTGEVEPRADDVGGIAVHIAARVMAAAGPGQILVSRTVRDLLAGSGVTLADRGQHTLRGVDGPWRLFEVITT